MCRPMSVLSLLGGLITGVAGATEGAPEGEPIAEEGESEDPSRQPAPAARPAHTLTWQPRARVVHSSFLALRVNPLGLVERVRFGYRHRLFEKDGALFVGAWADIGAEVTLAPTYAAGGVRLEVRPLSILGFSATYEFIGYFGALNAIMPIGSSQDDYWETTISERGARGEHYAAVGSRLTLSALFQIKVGPVIVRNSVSALRVDLGLNDGDSLMYDATQDIVLEDGGWAILNDLDVGAIIKKSAFGVRYSYADSLLGTGGPGDLPMHRVGPLFAYTFKDKPSGARFNKPTLLVLLQWYPQHPYRAGQRQSAGIPYAALAFQFEGDLWVSKR